MENTDRNNWVRCPFCKLYFRGTEAVLVKAKRGRLKLHTCERCGNEFSGGYYNRERDKDVHVAFESCVRK